MRSVYSNRLTLNLLVAFAAMACGPHSSPDASGTGGSSDGLTTGGSSASLQSGGQGGVVTGGSANQASLSGGRSSVTAGGSTDASGGQSGVATGGSAGQASVSGGRSGVATGGFAGQASASGGQAGQGTCITIAVDPSTVIETGTPMPDCIGDVAHLNVPTINTSGQLAFLIEATGGSVDRHNQMAVARYAGGAVSLLARGGDVIPQGNGSYQPVAADEIGPFRVAPRLANDSSVAVVAAYGVDIAAGEYFGLFELPSRAIATQSTTPPENASLRFEFDVASEIPPTLSLAADATYAFAAPLSGGSIAAGGVYSGQSGALGKIVDSLDPSLAPDGAPYLGPYGEDVIGFFPLGISAHGTLAFAARERRSVVPLGGSPARDVLLRKRPNAPLERLMAADDPLPSPEQAGDEISAFAAVKFAPDLNDGGDIALRVQLMPSAAAALVLVTDVGPTVIAREGRAAPGGGIFSHLDWQPAVNEKRDLAFLATVKASVNTTGDSGQVLVLARAGQLYSIARTGDRSPKDDGAFVGFADITDPRVLTNYTSRAAFDFLRGDRPNLNEAGQVAFMAAVDLDTGERVVGLYVYDGAKIHQVVRLGDTLAGTQVADLTFHSVQSPGIAGFNDSCQIAYFVSYLDGHEAIRIVDGCTG